MMFDEVDATSESFPFFGLYDAENCVCRHDNLISKLNNIKPRLVRYLCPADPDWESPV